MAIHALHWAFAQPINTSAKFVLVAIANHANAHGLAWPGVDRLAAMTGMHRATVFRALDQLLAARLLERETRPGQSNLYRLPEAATSRMVRPEVSQIATPPVAERDPTRRTVRPEPSMNHQQPERNHRAKPKRLIPEDWTASPDLLAWAGRDYPLVKDLDDETDRFRDYWIGRGEARASWDAAWRNWIRNAAKFAARSRPATKLDGIARRNAKRLDAAMARHSAGEADAPLARPRSSRLLLVAGRDVEHRG